MSTEAVTLIADHSGHAQSVQRYTRPMESFTADFHKANQDRDTAKIAETLAALKGWLVSAVDGRALTFCSRLPAKLFDLLQVGLRGNPMMLPNACPFR